MPLLPSDRSGLARAALVVAARAFIAGVLLYTLYFVIRAAVPTVFADSWWFTHTFVRHYVDGELTLADFFNKRSGGLDHAQPLHRLILYANLRWFDMDFTFEALVGTLFGVAYFGLLAGLVARELRGRPNALAMRELVFVGLAVSVFSFNSRELFTWSLVTVGFAYLLCITLYFLVARRLILQARSWWLVPATLLCCLLLDTSGVLATACVGALIVLIALRDRRLGPAARQLAALAAGVVVYRVGYAVLMAIPADSSVNAADQLGQLLGHMDEAWKLLVIPTSDALIATSRVYHSFGPDWVWPIAVPCALIVLAGHVWFWRSYLRHRDERLPFVAAGLMLLFYATLAGITWGRVPTQGFGYLTQPRYLMFYALQTTAFLLMATFLFARTLPEGAEPSRRTTPLAAALAGGVGVLAALAVFFMYSVRNEVGHLRWYELQLGRQIVTLGQLPPDAPASCPEAHLEVCDWAPQVRTSIIDVLKRGRFNVYSEKFLKRHGWKRKIEGKVGEIP